MTFVITGMVEFSYLLVLDGTSSMVPVILLVWITFGSLFTNQVLNFGLLYVLSANFVINFSLLSSSVVSLLSFRASIYVVYWSPNMMWRAVFWTRSIRVASCFVILAPQYGTASSTRHSVFRWAEI